MTQNTTSRRTFGISLLAGALGLVLTQPLCAVASTQQEKLVDEAANRFLRVIRNGAKREELAQLLEKYVATGSIAMFALGKHQRKMRQDETQPYLILFHEMILKALEKHGKKVSGKAFVVTGSRGGIVKGYVQHNLDRRTGLEFRTRSGKITDIRVQGFWLAITLRQSFDQLVEGGNGKLEPVFAFLRSDQTP